VKVYKPGMSVVIILLIVAASYPQICPPCHKNVNPLRGGGAARTLPSDKYTPCGCADDNRRIIRVNITSSWDIDAGGNSTPGRTNEYVWAAVQCAVDGRMLG
jgi:hypothetical protein